MTIDIFKVLKDEQKTLDLDQIINDRIEKANAWKDQYRSKENLAKSIEWAETEYHNVGLGRFQYDGKDFNYPKGSVRECNRIESNYNSMIHKWLNLKSKVVYDAGFEDEDEDDYSVKITITKK